MKLTERVVSWTRRFVFVPSVALFVLLNATLWFFLMSGDFGAWRLVVLAVAGIASVLAEIGLVRASSRAGRSLTNEVADVLTAGDWVMKHALGQSTLDEGVAGDATRDVAEIIRPLEDWLRTLRAAEQDPAFLTGGEVERDLQLAKEFQQAHLNRAYPRIPEVHIEGRLRLEFYHRYEPALALGGDFYDILTLAPDCAGVFIADVMGHGTRSALITSMLRTLIGDLQHQARNAPHFLTELNKQFCGMLKSLPSPLFASAYYFVPDTTGRVATYSSAGHPAPFMVRRHLKRVTRLEVPPPRGAALGLIPTETFTGGHVRLIPGDVCIFFTDGVYEAHNAQGEEFGVDRIEKILRKFIYRGGREMVDSLMSAVKEFVGKQPVMDDICIVAVEVTDKAVASDTRMGDTEAPRPSS